MGGRDAVRWGFRASFEKDSDGEPHRDRPARLGPTQGPRELPAEPARGSSWLAYTRAGAPIPLDLLAAAGGPAGALLDVRA
jgi:hypothetical protein